LTKDDLLKMLEAARAKGYEVFAPVKQEDLVMLARLDDATPVDFDHLLTLNTLKSVLLPQCEPVASLDLDRATASPTVESSAPILIFGTRPCDAAAVEVLDAIFLGSVRDARYAARRERSVIMTVGCSRSDEACFCTSMGYSPHSSAGSDVMVLPSRGGFVVRPVTEKGKDFLGKLGVAWREGGEEIDKEPAVAAKIDVTGLKAILDANFDSPVWHEISQNCVSCGTCAYLCPTCHCFDIADEVNLSRGERLRIWDCCSFSDFTKMAGHQPRAGRHARYRQRVMHKFSYLPDNVGKVACVGDGRCIRHCPYGVDIREALEKLRSAGDKKPQGPGESTP
jgi:ferredoxin